MLVQRHVIQGDSFAQFEGPTPNFSYFVDEAAMSPDRCQRICVPYKNAQFWPEMPSGHALAGFFNFVAVNCHPVLERMGALWEQEQSCVRHWQANVVFSHLLNVTDRMLMLRTEQSDTWNKINIRGRSFSNILNAESNLEKR